MAPASSTWHSICPLFLQAQQEAHIKAACFQSLSRSSYQYKALWDINYQWRDHEKKGFNKHMTYVQWFRGAGKLLLHTEQMQSCCWCSQSIPQNKRCESCRQPFTGTDAPKCIINFYPLGSVPGLREFCISPFTHSHVYIAKMLLLGQ